MTKINEIIFKLHVSTSIRTKVILSLLAVILIIGVSSIIIGLKIINSGILNQAYDDVQNNLNTAYYIYQEKMSVKHRFFNYISYLTEFQVCVANYQRDEIMKKLHDLKKELDFDILNVVDANGVVIVRSNDFSKYGDNLSKNTFVKYVVKYLKSVHGSAVFTETELEKEGLDLAKRFGIKIINTPRSRENSKKIESSALVIGASAPIFFNGKLVGIIYGVKILNHNHSFIDDIVKLIFKNEMIDESAVGTATIFLDDVRIATNVKNHQGIRAVGTRVSEEVYKEVFEQGKTWIDKAFVVHKWYLSGYRPIFDLEHNIIGIFYVGILKEKYDKILKGMILSYLFIIIVSGAIAIVIAIYLVSNILRPMKGLIETSKEIIKGNYQTVRLYDVHRDDEMGYFARVYNNMIQAILERDRLLKEQTEKQILESEKMASLGRLASGIAHEINNPLTGVLTYASILLEDFVGTKYEEDIAIIVQETMRCRKIVKGILDFAKVTRLEKNQADINEIIYSVLTILERHMNFQNITIKKNLQSDMPKIVVDITQIKSVLNNLAVNAADAMPDGGELCISTEYDKSRDILRIIVSDTGTGIPQDIISRVFDPFFTTKEAGKGTGLGLAVTYGIIKRHNGSISIKSEVGKGTEITIELPFL